MGRLCPQGNTEGQVDGVVRDRSLEYGKDKQLHSTDPRTEFFLCPLKVTTKWDKQEDGGGEDQDELTTQETLLLKDHVQTFQRV